MAAKKSIRQKNLIKTDKIEGWTDEEVLTNLTSLLTRASITTEFVTEEMEEQTIITHEVLIAQCGDKAVFSAPRALDWPLQMMPVPDAFREVLN